MLVFAREVFVCTCSTDVPRRSPAELGVAEPLRFRRGSEADVARLDPRFHGDEHAADFRARLSRGEHWLIGEVDGDIVTYTWLHRRDRAAYPSLPGCEVALSPETGYGYDAWTNPDLRGRGLRRAAFVEELGILRDWGLRREASFFVQYQLDGATRSLAEAGIRVEPHWRVWLGRGRRLEAEPVGPGGEAAVPVFLRAPAESV